MSHLLPYTVPFNVLFFTLYVNLLIIFLGLTYSIRATSFKRFLKLTMIEVETLVIEVALNKNRMTEMMLLFPALALLQSYYQIEK